jgi:hypothetical protein
MKGDQSEALNYIFKNNHAKIRPIMFINKLFIDAESRYWLTEFEIAYIIWTVRKIRHLIIKSKYDSNSLSKDKNILEDIINKYYYYNAAVIEMSDEFKNNIKKEYDDKNR